MTELGRKHEMVWLENNDSLLPDYEFGLKHGGVSILSNMVGEYFRKTSGGGYFRKTEWIRVGRANRRKNSEDS